MASANHIASHLSPRRRRVETGTRVGTHLCCDHPLRRDLVNLLPPLWTPALCLGAFRQCIHWRNHSAASRRSRPTCPQERASRRWELSGCKVSVWVLGIRNRTVPYEPHIKGVVGVEGFKLQALGTQMNRVRSETAEFAERNVARLPHSGGSLVQPSTVKSPRIWGQGDRLTTPMPSNLADAL